MTVIAEKSAHLLKLVTSKHTHKYLDIDACSRFPYKGVCRKFEKSAEYQLYAVINHQGSIESGHCKLT